MAHWALLDENNVVTNVVVGNNEEEDEGESFLRDVIGGTWIKTSINTLEGVHYSKDLDENGNRIPSEDQSKALRKNFAGIGMVYDPVLDEFNQAPEKSEVTIIGGPEANTQDETV